MKTVIIGAGPAGLLFTLMRSALGGHGGLILVDKRETYVRTHRLRMDPEPFREIGRTLTEGLFADLVQFLEVEQYKPSINLLESELSQHVSSLGIPRLLLHVSNDPGAVPLMELPHALQERGMVDEGEPLVVVAADSVHSETRGGLADRFELHGGTYETVARLTISGDHLPTSLSAFDQYRFVKKLQGVLDYRANANGFVEVDLFLNRSEHRAVEALGANPKSPVRLDRNVLPALHAPMFTSTVANLRKFLGSEHTVELKSTFRLEHQYAVPAAVRLDSDAPSSVFLLGDAAVSLPFFRGMASTTRCAWALARIHKDLQTGAVGEAVSAYNQAVEEIRHDELTTVRNRGKLIRAAGYTARVSALLPFPIQSWVLSLDRPVIGGRLTPWSALNGLVAVTAFVLWFLSMSPPPSAPIPPFALGLLALVIQGLGGATYMAARRKDSTNPALAMVWRIQIFSFMLSAILILAGRGTWPRSLSDIHLLTAWFTHGLVFAGVVAAEVVVRSDSG